MPGWVLWVWREYLYDGLLDDDVVTGSTTIRMEAPGGGFSTEAHNPAVNSFYDFATLGMST